MNHSISRLLGILGVLLLIIVIVLGLGWLRIYLQSGSKSVWPTSVVDTYRAGDFADAITNRDAIAADPNKTEEEKAMAVFNSLGAEYKVTGDTGALLKDIQAMKSIITNEMLTPVLRAETLDVLAKEYAITGRNPAVFAEIYKDAPFSSYLAPGDPELSSRHLAEWSYKIMPSSNAAILVANWYTTQLAQKKDMPKATQDEYVASAQEYLQKADAASIEEAKWSTTYTDSRRYLYYMFYRTVVAGQLSNYLSEYKGTYGASFDQFIALAKSQNNPVAAEFSLFAHLAYAQLLLRDGDTASAKAQLDALADELSTVTADQAKSNGFVQSIKNERQNNPTGARWTGIAKMTTISSKFKSALDTVIGSQQ